MVHSTIRHRNGGRCARSRTARSLRPSFAITARGDRRANYEQTPNTQPPLQQVSPTEHFALAGAQQRRGPDVASQLVWTADEQSVASLHEQ
jgi:hypothetical protein